MKEESRVSQRDSGDPRRAVCWSDPVRGVREDRRSGPGHAGGPLCHGEILLGTPAVWCPEAGLPGDGHPPGLLSTHTASVLVGASGRASAVAPFPGWKLSRAWPLLPAVTSY